ncbi:MAG: hypothetical protein ACLR5S_03360 [Ruminococcus sp.]
MTFEEMFAQAKTMLENASAKNADTAVAVQFDVSGEGCGAFYAVVSADSDKLTIEPYDYKGHDVLVSADAAELLDALRSAETDALTVEGDWDKVAVFREVLATLPTPKKAAAPKAKAPAKKTAAKAAPKMAEAPKTAAATVKDGTGKVAATGGCNRKEGNRQAEALRCCGCQDRTGKVGSETAAATAKVPAAKPAATCQDCCCEEQQKVKAILHN